jgi:hypothetical protein
MITKAEIAAFLIAISLILIFLFGVNVTNS